MLKSKVLDTIRRYGMLKTGDKVVVAFSGGVDSTALLYILYELRNKLKIRLFAAHLDHMIRGKESNDDQKFAALSAKKLKIPYFAEGFDVPAFAKQKKVGLEDAARMVRYSFLERVATKCRANKIAVAHNADDNIETFLMRLLRGSGMKGLESIPPVRDKIIRPLLNCSREEIEVYLKDINVKPRIDRSNMEVKYTRNKIRHELIPILKAFNGNIKTTLSRTIYAVSTDHDLIEKEGKIAFEEIAVKKPWITEIELKEIRKFHPALQAQILRNAIKWVKNDLMDISFTHIEDILSLLSCNRAELDLPGAHIFINKGKVRITKKKENTVKSQKYNIRLEVPGLVNIKEAGYEIESEVLGSGKNINYMAKDPYQAFIDLDKISTPLIARSRKDGDVFRPLGLKGKKKLQDIFVDEKIDHDERDFRPLIDDGKDIVWVVGFRISDKVKITDKTRNILKLTAHRI